MKVEYHSTIKAIFIVFYFIFFLMHYLTVLVHFPWCFHAGEHSISAHRSLNHTIKLTQQLKYNGHIITLIHLLFVE